MGIIDLIPGGRTVQLIVLGVIAAALIGAVTFAVHHYNESLRQDGRDEEKAVWVAATKKQKDEAAQLLAAESAKVRAADSALAAFKDKQEITDANNRELTQAQERRLGAIAGPAGRLRDPFAAAGRGGGGGGSQGATAASTSGGATGPAETPGLLSARLSGFLLEQARSADEINDAYASCRADALNLRATVK